MNCMRMGLKMLVIVVLALLVGCGTSRAVVSPEMPNERLREALVVEFPIGSTRTFVQRKAENLGLHPVQGARVVDADGNDVDLSNIRRDSVNFSERGWRVVEITPKDPTMVSYQLTKPGRGDKSADPKSPTRALMFRFCEAHRLLDLAASPAVESGTGRVLQDGFLIAAEPVSK